MSKFRIETRKVVKTVDEPIVVMEFTQEEVRLLRMIVGELDGASFQKLCKHSNISRPTDGWDGDFTSSAQLQPLYNVLKEAHEALRTKE